MSEYSAGDSGVRDDSSSVNASTDADSDQSPETVDSRPVVYDLAPDCTLEDVEAGNFYHADVNGVVEYGVFVDISDSVSGLVHESNLSGSHAVGEKFPVELLEIKENGDIAFGVISATDYRTETVDHQPDISRIQDLAANDIVTIEGEVVQAKQTGGPTVFSVSDASGIVDSAAFEEAGVRAYPEIQVGDMVHIAGEVQNHEGGLQLEVDSLTALEGTQRSDARDRYEQAVAERSQPADGEQLVEWDAFDPIYDDLREVAAKLRRTVLKGRPIRVRHHADGDGMCAAIPLQHALENYISEVQQAPDAPLHQFKRLPSKAPFYEMEDVTRDLNFALEGQARHGQKLPLLLMVDNGSTAEDVPAYENLAHYDIPIMAVDHHHPDPDAVDPLLDAHVNPYLYDENYRITTGMMCVELARLIDPEVDGEFDHVPAVAGVSDRSMASAMDDYVALAGESGYDRDDLLDISEALDYAAHWLRYSEGKALVNDVLNIDCDDFTRHEDLVEFLSTRATRDINRQLTAIESHVGHERLDSGARLYRVDLDEYAHRFTYPAPGKTTGKLHGQKVQETGDPVITIGYGPDFCVLRSDGVRLDIPQMVSELKTELPEAGVSGGGHLVVGSIKFVKGRRESVLETMIEKMATAQIDKTVSTAGALDL